ncbi:hypothetical protein ACFB49_20690 [Sphingomonas sp. DBB INV C78]
MPLGELFDQLVQEGKDVARAEVDVYRRKAVGRLMAARLGLALILGGVLIAFAAASAILVGLAIGLAKYIGPVGGGLAAGAIGLLIAALLVKLGANRLSPASDTKEMIS